MRYLGESENNNFIVTHKHTNEGTVPVKLRNSYKTNVLDLNSLYSLPICDSLNEEYQREIRNKSIDSLLGDQT